MFNDATGFKKVYVACGYTDLRRGIDGLAAIIKFQYQLEPRDRNTLFLFCGRKSDRLKGLLWEGDGWLLLYKRIETGGFNWPRTSSEAIEITESQFLSLMKGFDVVPRRPIKDAGNLPLIM
jgi:transposase